MRPDHACAGVLREFARWNVVHCILSVIGNRPSRRSFLKKHFLVSMVSLGAGIALILPFVPVPAKGQFPAESTIPKDQRKGKGTGRGGAKGGPPVAPAPRAADGHPDLSAAWGYAGVTSDIAKDYDV